MKITVKNEKPELNFKCSICKSEYKTDDWKVTEIQNGMHTYLFMGFGVQEKPMSRCPVCNMKNYN